jgi:hypothetical protein
VANVTSIERKASVIALLIGLEPRDAHDARCPAKTDHPKACTCHLIRNARVRAEALDEAGLLRPIKYKE